MRLSISILCGDDPHHRYLQWVLGGDFEVRLVVTEPAAAQRRRVLLRHRFLDYGALVYHGWRRRLLGLDRYRRHYFTLPPGAELPRCRRETLDSINDVRVSEHLRAASSQVVIVMGTSILRAPTLSAAGPCILNVHGGFLPDYRGNHCFFWAMYDGRLDRLGSTIHFVDAGVDAGDIVEVVAIAAGDGESPETAYCRAEREAIERLRSLLLVLQAGGQLPRTPQLGAGRTHRNRDRGPWHDVALLLRSRRTSRASSHRARDNQLPTISSVSFRQGIQRWSGIIGRRSNPFRRDS